MIPLPRPEKPAGGPVVVPDDVLVSQLVAQARANVHLAKLADRLGGVPEPDTGPRETAEAAELERVTKWAAAVLAGREF